MRSAILIAFLLTAIIGAYVWMHRPLPPHSARVTIVLHDINDGLPQDIHERAQAAAVEMASHSPYPAKVEKVEAGK